MSYATGVPSSTQNLINTLIAFLVSDGGFTLANTWTYTAGAAPISSQSSGAVSYTARALVRDSQYVNIAWTTTSPAFLFLNTSTNNPTTGRINQQTSCSIRDQTIELGLSPLNYFLFSDTLSTHCCVQWVGGGYQHINVGIIEKYGSFVGGVYVTGTFNDRNQVSGPNYLLNPKDGRHTHPFASNSLTSANGNLGVGHVRANYGGFSHHSFSRSLGVSEGIAVNLASMGPQPSSDTNYQWWYTRSPNSYNGRAVLCPVEIGIAETAASNPASFIPLGRVSNACHINMKNLNAQDVILTDWMIFPYSAKNVSGTVASGIINSENYAMAYRK